MSKYEKELTPLTYSNAGVKVLKSFMKEAGEECFRMHWHDRLEFLIIKEGSLLVSFATEQFTAQKGSTVIIPARCPHFARAGESGVTYDVVMLDIRMFFNETMASRESLEPLYDGRARTVPITREREVTDCLCAIADSQNGPLSVMSLVYGLVYLIYKHCLVELARASAFTQRFREITDYIEKNYGEHLSTEHLCSVFGYTKPYFCRKFKEHTGLSPGNFIKIYRMERAYKLIKDGSRNIGEIALRCGYDDANYFTRCFSAHFNNPPSYYFTK